MTLLEPLTKSHSWYEGTASWVGNPRGQDKDHVICKARQAGELELLSSRRSSAGELSDDEPYQYDDYALVRHGKDLYLLRTTGCSCPSPDETWEVAVGPVKTEAELVEWLEEEPSYFAEKHPDLFLDLFARVRRKGAEL